MFYTRQAYKRVDPATIAAEIQAQGFDPIPISDTPGYIYPPHEHPETKLLVFLKGTMDVTIGNETFHCGPGDRVYIPGNVTHSARVGTEGCTFFWSEKIIR